MYTNRSFKQNRELMNKAELKAYYGMSEESYKRTLQDLLTIKKFGKVA